MHFNPEDFMTAQEAADHLDITKSYIYWLRATGKLPTIKMFGTYLFKVQDLEEWNIEREEKRELLEALYSGQISIDDWRDQRRRLVNH